MLHVDAHGAAGPFLVPLQQKGQDGPVVPQGDVLHPLAAGGDLQDFIHGAVDDGIEPPHILVVGRLDNGPVELLVRQGPVASLGGDALHPLRLPAEIR